MKWAGRNRNKLTDQERRIIEKTPVHEAPIRIPANHQGSLLPKKQTEHDNGHHHYDDRTASVEIIRTIA